MIEIVSTFFFLGGGIPRAQGNNFPSPGNPKHPNKNQTTKTTKTLLNPTSALAKKEESTTSD
jgi:hypothetical protein